MNNNDLYCLFEKSPVPMWVFDVTTLQFLDVNVAATIAYGYSREEFLSMTINHIRPSDDVQSVISIVAENSQTGKFYKNTFRHVSKTGELFQVEIASNLITFAGRQARVVIAINVTEKIQAQAAVLLNEHRFMALVQDGTDMIAIVDRSFRYKYLSPASIRVLGAEPDFLIGQKVYSYIHPDDLDRVEHEVARIWETKTVLLSPYRYRNADDNWIWLETKATNLYNDPSVEGIVCTSTNISERISVEKLLKENIERYNIVSKATSDVIWDCYLEANVIIWNKAIKGILKYPDTETTYDWWKDRLHPQDRHRVLERLDKHIKAGILKWQEEYRFLCGDGSYKHIFDRGFLLSDGKGTASRMIGAMQDITKRKEEENWSKLLESVIVNTSDGVLITDASSPRPIIVYVNDALLSMSGYAREELIGNFLDVLHTGHQDQTAIQQLNIAISRKEEIKVELLNSTKEGVDYYVSVNLTPVYGADGALANWVSIRRDVSEQRRYVTEIEGKNKQLTEISWMQSHVARAPLARIMSLVELLENCNDQEERMELMGHLRGSADELDEIITTIANHT